MEPSANHRFQLVPRHTGGALVVLCQGCGKTLRQTEEPLTLRRGFLADFFYTRIFADLNGKAFEAYYCEPCKVSKSPSAQTV